MYQREIAKGMSLLDEKKPGWQNLVDLQILQLSSGCSCVLGQLFDSFSRGCDVLNINYRSAEFGFCTAENYVKLTQEWREAITATLQAAK